MGKPSHLAYTSCNILCFAWRECHCASCSCELSAFTYLSDLWKNTVLVTEHTAVCQKKKKRTTHTHTCEMCSLAPLWHERCLKWKLCLLVVSCSSRCGLNTSVSCYTEWLSGTVTLNTSGAELRHARCVKIVSHLDPTLWEHVSLYSGRCVACQHAGELPGSCSLSDPAKSSRLSVSGLLWSGVKWHDAYPVRVLWPL